MSKHKPDRVAELRAIYDDLKQQEVALKVQIDEAGTNLHAAEREFKRQEKPTPSMLALLAQMASGTVIKRSMYHPYRYFASSSNGDGGTPKVLDSVFYGLLNRETIGSDGASEWRINDHGLAVLRQWAK